MSSILLNAVIDRNAGRAESTIQCFRDAWGDYLGDDDCKLNFVHFREVSDFMAVASGNNRFTLIVVAVGGLDPASLQPLVEFESQSSIVRVLDEDVIVDDTPSFRCKTIRFPLHAPVLNALFTRVQCIDTSSPMSSPARSRESSAHSPPVISPLSLPARSRSRSISSPLVASSSSMSPLVRSMNLLPQSVAGSPKRKESPVPSPTCKRRAKAAAATASLRRHDAQGKPNGQERDQDKERDSSQGPKLWQDIFAPAKLLLEYDRNTGSLTMRHADETAIKNLEISPEDLRDGKDFNDFYGDASTEATRLRILESIESCASASFYVNLYTATTRTALSAHVSTSVLCFDHDAFDTQSIISVVVTLRSASVVGNAKLIGYSLHSAGAQSVLGSPRLRENILQAFGMN